MVLVSHLPHRWKDVTQCQLLIWRTCSHYRGRLWLAYDQAFREHAAATKQTDWSAMNVQLFNFHAAGTSVRSSTVQSLFGPEPPGSSVAVAESCISWGVVRLPFLCADSLIVAVCAPDLIALLLALRTPATTRGRTGSDGPAHLGLQVHLLLLKRAVFSSWGVVVLCVRWDVARGTLYVITTLYVVCYVLSFFLFLNRSLFFQ